MGMLAPVSCVTTTLALLATADTILGGSHKIRRINPSAYLTPLCGPIQSCSSVAHHVGFQIVQQTGTPYLGATIYTLHSSRVLWKVIRLGCKGNMFFFEYQHLPRCAN